MIALEIISALAIAYRIRTRQMRRTDVMLILLVVLSLLMVFAQAIVCGGLPERRYWSQILILLYPYGIWGIHRCWTFRRFGVARLGCVLLAAFLAYDVINLVRVRIPGVRRQIYIAACDWAVERIREDWKGPSRDAGDVYWEYNYCSPLRPAVQAHTPRVAYLLGGRRHSNRIAAALGTECDYWFNQVTEKTPPPVGYESIGRFSCGKYAFELYRRPEPGVR